MLSHWGPHKCPPLSHSSWCAHLLLPYIHHWHRYTVITLRTTQNGSHAAEHIFKLISLNENCSILIIISSKIVSHGLNKQFEMMAWCVTGDNPLSETMLIYCQLDNLEQISVKFLSECVDFNLGKYVWKCLLHHGSHSDPSQQISRCGDFCGSRELYTLFQTTLRVYIHIYRTLQKYSTINHLTCPPTNGSTSPWQLVTWLHSPAKLTQELGCHINTDNSNENNFYWVLLSIKTH